MTVSVSPAQGWVLYCRPGFERDCAQEAYIHALRQGAELRIAEAVENSGYVRLEGRARAPDWSALVFARQALSLLAMVELPERDRLTPLLDALPAQPAVFADVWLEMPDTNDGKALSAFTRRFAPLLQDALIDQRRLGGRPDGPRLHVFFPDKQRAWLALGDPRLSAPWPMGILRLRMPPDAPSRSALKLAEAFDMFLSAEDQQRYLHDGLRAVDLGAAPGGWTWQLLRRGLRVIAVDNGPLKGMVAEHPWVTHLRTDGFRFRPDRPVDWVVCDMVEKPSRVATLMANWLIGDHARHAMFNLKLPMKKRQEALESALNDIETLMQAHDIRYRLSVKQLYHDREEVTVYLGREARPRRNSNNKRR